MIFSEEHKANIGRANSKPKSEKGRAAIRKCIQARNAINVTCPHCGKVGRANGMGRWHFNNCKEKD